MSIRHGLVVVLAVSAIVAPAAQSGGPTPVSPSQPVVVKVSEAFHWLDAGLGVAAGIAASLVVLGLALTLRQGSATRQEGDRNEEGTHAEARSWTR